MALESSDSRFHLEMTEFFFTSFRYDLLLQIYD